RIVAGAVDFFALLVQRARLADVVAVALEVTVQFGDVGGDELTLGIVPGTIADAVAGVDGSLCSGGRRAEIRAPRAVAGVDGCRERLAMLVGSSEPAEVATVTRADAGDEKAHRR